jgi:hypothetical protein
MAVIHLRSPQTAPERKASPRGGPEGAEFTIIDAKPQASFGGVVTGGGSNHYKVRYDETNWIRIG